MTNPIEMTVRGLRRMALSACQDKTRFHICVIKFRTKDMVATNGAMLVVVPLPEDKRRDFALPVHGVLEATATWDRDAVVTITRNAKATILTVQGKECGYSASVPDGQDAQYPPIEVVMERSRDGSFADFFIGPRMMIQVARVARDLCIWMPGLRDKDWTGVRLIATQTEQGPMHFSFAAEHGHALVLAMPLRLP